jgi:hypothetical protein
MNGDLGVDLSTLPVGFGGVYVATAHGPWGYVLFTTDACALLSERLTISFQGYLKV